MIPLIDVLAQYRSLQADIDEAVRETLDSGNYVLGPNVAGLEDEIAGYLGASRAVGVASGTDALHLSLVALGIGPGDEVVVPAYSFFATAEAVMNVGARPVFVDISLDSYCMDPALAEEVVTERTKAIIVVHLFGHPADMDAIGELAVRHGLKVIEDNAQALGAANGGRKTGVIGDAGCLSFFPTKNLGGFGDGGMVVTNDSSLAEEVKLLRSHGSREKHVPSKAGFNSRLDELQAAILRVKLPHVDRWNERRREIAHRYSDRLSSPAVFVPRVAPGVTHAYHLYVLRMRDRDEARRKLDAVGIASAVYYPRPLPQTDACREFATGDFPNAETACRESLALPMYPELDDSRVEEVLAALEGVAAKAGS
ncbi:MAG: DegT/DnrJ/EryC1/StrS family aminotransferase [Actinomycetota bacterium]